MTLAERRRSLTSCQDKKNYFDINKYYNKTGWTVENGVAYSAYNYGSNDVSQYGSLPFYLDAGTYQISFDMMLSKNGTVPIKYRYLFQNLTDNIVPLRIINKTFPNANEYYNISYTVSLKKTAQCRIAMTAEYGGFITYLKNIRIEKVG